MVADSSQNYRTALRRLLLAVSPQRRSAPAAPSSGLFRVPAERSCLTLRTCDSRTDHMKTASVRDLRYHFAEIEARLREGEEIQIRKRKRVIARLVPERRSPKRPWPDFMARLQHVYGKKRLKVTGAELLARERDRY